MTFRAGLTSPQHLIVLLVCWWAFAFQFVRPNFYNDHFDHLSKARQVLFGEHPQRDFFDPGRPLTIYASAAVQKISPTLLSEFILTTVAIAVGVAFVYVLARSLSQSTLLGLLAALLTVSLQPRLYGYPKILLFPWSLWLLWRYIDRPGRWRLVQLALMTVLAFLFRHDLGMYMAAVYVLTLLAVHRGQAVPALAVYIVVQIVASGPYLMWLAAQGLLQSTGSSGFMTMARTIPGLTIVPVRLDLSHGLMTLVPRPAQLGVRWRIDTDADTRQALEHRYGLHERDRKDARSIRYFMDDPSPARILTMIDDRNVEDTSGVDRGSGELLDPSSWTRLQNVMPLFRLTTAPMFPSRDDAAAWIYYVFVLSVPLALVALWLLSSESARGDATKVASLAFLCLLLHQFMLRGSLDSRLPDVAGPTAVLLAWLGRLAFDAGRRLAGAWAWAGRAAIATATALFSVITWSSVTTYAGTSLIDVVAAGRVPLATFTDVTQRLRGRPIDYWTDADSVGVRALIRYVGRCLSPEDRPFLVMYAPEVFYVAGRLFAGGINVFHADVYSSPDEQRVAIARLQRQSVPIVIVEDSLMKAFENNYSDIERYVASRYREAAVLGFGTKGRAFHVLVDSQRVPVRAEPRWGLPCFQAGS